MNARLTLLLEACSCEAMGGSAVVKIIGKPFIKAAGDLVMP